MKLLQIDDHLLFREGLARLLEDFSPRLEIRGTGQFAEGLQLLAKEADFDLVLLDMRLPDAAGPEMITQLRTLPAAPPIVCLTGDNSRETILASIAAGAMGYIPKSASSEALLAALRVVLTGGIYLPASIHEAEPAPLHHPELSPRQREVLRLLLEGHSNKDICRVLGLAPATIKTHVSAVLRALNVTTRTQAVLAASRLDLRF